MRRLRIRFLCPECSELRQVVRASDDGPNVILACGHRRTAALLPSRGISLEHLDTAVGRRLFPYERGWSALMEVAW